MKLHSDCIVFCEKRYFAIISICFNYRTKLILDFRKTKRYLRNLSIKYEAKKEVVNIYCSKFEKRRLLRIYLTRYLQTSTKIIGDDIVYKTLKAKRQNDSMYTSCILDKVCQYL